MVKTRSQRGQEDSEPENDQSTKQYNNSSRVNKKSKKVKSNKSKRSRTRYESDTCSQDEQFQNCSHQYIEISDDDQMNSSRVSNKYEQNQNEDEKEECIICLIDINNQKATYNCKSCNKQYHGSCLQQWLSTKEVFLCPWCNQSPFK